MFGKRDARRFVVFTCLLLAFANASRADTISVPASEPWSGETCRNVPTNAFVSVIASGEWASGTWTGDADGFGTNGAGAGYLAPDAPPYSLVGRFGSGDPAAVGSDYMGITLSGGILGLSMNDVPGIFWDNSGFLSADVDYCTTWQDTPVPATSPWSATSYTLGIGERLAIQATGSWTTGTWTGGPEGFGTNGAGDGCLAPDAVPYSLIGKIGDGSPFYIGPAYRGFAYDSGVLQLSMNDVPGIFWDNSGSISAVVGVVDPLADDCNTNGIPDECEADGLIARYTFEEGQGGVAYDVSGNGHHLELRGATWSEGLLGGAALDTRLGYGVAPHATELELSGSYTVAAWVRKDTKLGMAAVCALSYCYTHDGNWDFQYNIEDESSVSFINYPQGSGGSSGYWTGGAWIGGGPNDPDWGDIGAGPVYFAAGEWVHIATTYDDMASVASIYVEGQLLRQDPWDSEVGGSQAEFTVGTDHLMSSGDLCGSDHFFQGDIDDLRVYDRALSQAEILGLQDCNGNETADECDVATGFSDDCNTNGVPDECDPDFDGDGVIDDCDPDIDDDGMANEDDACDYTPPGATIVTDPQSPLYGTLPYGDLDNDCDSDLADYALLQEVFTGPNGR